MLKRYHAEKFPTISLINRSEGHSGKSPDLPPPTDSPLRSIVSSKSFLYVKLNMANLIERWMGSGQREPMSAATCWAAHAGSV